MLYFRISCCRSSSFSLTSARFLMRCWLSAFLSLKKSLILNFSLRTGCLKPERAPGYFGARFDRGAWLGTVFLFAWSACSPALVVLLAACFMFIFLFAEFISPGVNDLMRGLSGSSAGPKLSCILWRIGLRLPALSLMLYRF